MKIEAHLKSIDKGSFLHDVNQLMTKAKGEVSWGGKKVITIKGYEDSFELSRFLNELIVPFFSNKRNFPDLHQRVDGLSLLDKTLAVFGQAEIATQNTWLVKYIPQAGNLLGISGELRLLDAQVIVESLSRTVREFEKEQYLKIFTGYLPESQVVSVSILEPREHWIVSRESLIKVSSPV
jgi:hypothetical protein